MYIYRDLLQLKSIRVKRNQCKKKDYIFYFDFLLRENRKLLSG